MTARQVAAGRDVVAEAGLDPDAAAHVKRLLGAWGVLADLSFSDLLLLTPPSSPEGGSSEEPTMLVVGQMRPTTAATLLGSDMVGERLDAHGWRAAAQACATGAVVLGDERLAAVVGAFGPAGEAFDTGELRGPEPAEVECVPVRYEGRVVAVMVRIAAAEQRRRRSRLERVYRELYQRLARMVADGTYPAPFEQLLAEDAPRVGDGLVVLDAEGRIRFASPNATNALHRMGVTAALEGRTLGELGIDDAPVARAFERGLPVVGELESPPDVVVLVHATPLRESGVVTGAMVLVRDVTDLRRLNRLLVSKDAAIREVHHRVKNNLQTISSLLRLQSRRVGPGAGREALLEAERRVRSIAVVHEVLSREPGDEVPFGEIVGAVVRMAEEAAPPDRPVAIAVRGDAGELPADVATPLAVVLAELLQNAVEHAFAPKSAHVFEGQPGDWLKGEEGAGQEPRRRRLGPAAVGSIEVTIARHQAPGSTRLVVEVVDDGRGLPPGFDLDTTTTLGLSIVRDLVRTQLGGTIQMTSGQGTEVHMEIPLALG
jgi:two-component sensor histidine kinase